MRFQQIRRKRRGAALVEAVLSTTVFLTLVLGMMDLCIALFHMHVASEAARQGARVAIVHGYLAPSDSSLNAWGPTPSYLPALATQSIYASSSFYSVQADASADELAATIRPYLVGFDPSTVTLTIAWPDGSNDLGNRVSVTVTAPYCHLLPFLVGSGSVNLGATSTMTVVH